MISASVLGDWCNTIYVTYGASSYNITAYNSGNTKIIKNGSRIADIGGEEIFKNIRVGESELEIANRSSAFETKSEIFSIGTCITHLESKLTEAWQ